MSKKNIVLAAVLILFGINAVFSQGRVRASLNSDWFFHKGDSSNVTNWENINLPHSFNTDDVTDDEPGYYRGDVWYKKKLFAPKSWEAKEVCLFFEGANQVAEVFINGKKAGEHVGGYSGFQIRIDKLLKFDSDNNIAIKLTNGFNPDIPPLTADFTFFGGIYRDVFVEVFERIHFETENFGSDGIFITTPEVSKEKGVVQIRGVITNNTTASQKVVVKAALFHPGGLKVDGVSFTKVIRKSSSLSFSTENLSVLSPALWSPEHPVLYHLKLTIEDANGNVFDEIHKPVGFRWFSFSADGFFLNGHPYKIWGASRHQDFPSKGNALDDQLHVKDVEHLKNMGANFLRVAHYPQDPAVLEACDRLGLLASVEIPLVNAITESKAFDDHSKTMMVEMIRQHYNHPSIVMWASMNEILLRPPFGNDKPRQEIYFRNVTRLAKTLDSLSRKEDPTRYTMMAYHGNFDLYKRTGLIDIPMVAGWNLYQGWYSPDIAGFGKFLDKHHEVFPDKPMLITEYGADGDPRIHTNRPVRFDKSVEYETYYHQVYIDEIAKRDFVAGGLVWNLADFNSETRAESMPHINNKGLLDAYRKPKDSYQLYKAFLSKEPFLEINSGWNVRSGFASGDSSDVSRQHVYVFTNVTDVLSLYHNERLLEEKTADKFVAIFDVPFVAGTNNIRVATSDGSLSADAKIIMDLTTTPLSDNFEDIRINFGDNRFVHDPDNDQTWLPEMEYVENGIGFIGGRPFTPKDKSRQQFGSDKNIMGTELDPIFATQRIGVESFKMRVPPGEYDVIFHFAELERGPDNAALVYNLGKEQSSTNATDIFRSFNVYVNGKKVIDELSNANYLVPAKAVTIKSRVSFSKAEDMVIRFESIAGETIINAIHIRRIF